jgi:hypothetical protein
VLADPKKFRQGEIGKRWIAGELNQTIATEEIRKLLYLGLGALIAPDERGTDHFIAGIEQDRSVHLPGETDGGNLIRAHARERAADGLGAGAPPIARILLGPSGLGRSEGGMRFGSRGNNLPALVQDESACATCTDINAEELDTTSLAWTQD